MAQENGDYLGMCRGHALLMANLHGGALEAFPVQRPWAPAWRVQGGEFLLRWLRCERGMREGEREEEEGPAPPLPYL